MSRIVRFALQFVPLFVVLVLLFPTVLPLCKTTVRSLTNPVLGLLSPTLHIDANAEDGWDVSRVRRGGRTQRILTITAESLRLIYVSFILLPALLLATPMPWRRRVQLTLLGLALLVVLQALSHVLFVAAWARYYRSDRSADTFRMIVTIHSTTAQLLPLGLWGLLAWRGRPVAASGSAV